jgi:hypothetical protein
MAASNVTALRAETKPAKVRKAAAERFGRRQWYHIEASRQIKNKTKNPECERPHMRPRARLR